MRRITILIVLCLIATACGGNGGGPTTTDPGSDDGQPVGDQEATTTSSPETTTAEPDGGVSGESGRVTIDLGDRSYEFLTTWTFTSGSSSSTFTGCHLHDDNNYLDGDYFEVRGFAIENPGDSVEPDVTPELTIVIWHSPEETNAYIDENWDLPIQASFTVDDRANGLRLGAYAKRNASELSELSGDTSWLDDYAGIGSWTTEGNRVAGEIYLAPGYLTGEADFDEPVLASFEITCPG